MGISSYNFTSELAVKDSCLQKLLSAIREKLRDGRSLLVNCFVQSLICFLSGSRLSMFQEIVWTKSPKERARPEGGKLTEVPTC